MKKYRLAVSDFALPSPLRGSIDTHSGFGRGSQAGLELHQRIQARRREEHANYQSEVPVSHVFEAGGFAFDVHGRMDGFFTGDLPKIEEIKSAFNIYDLGRRLREAPDEHPYCLQVKTYGYFHFLRTGIVPELILHLVSSRNGETADFELNLDVSQYGEWLTRRLPELVADAKLDEKRAKRRRKTAGELVFPFRQPRPGQIELIATIEEGMRENRPMLVQAPTGLGKTLGVMYPTLKEALARGQRLIYVTPKNSQHGVAEDAVTRLQDGGANIRGMTLTAKSKMCFKAEPLCNSEYCEFAKDHYTKVAENGLLAKLSKKKSLTAKVFKSMAEEHRCCPFELQIDATKDADAIICDYNYVFAPRSAVGRLTGGGLDQEGKPNLVIDEAHNLPSRAMDYYSPSLSVAALESMRDDLLKIPIRFRNEAMDLLDECIDVVRKAAPPGTEQPRKIEPPIDLFLEQDGRLRSFLSSYLNSDVDIQPRDPVMRLSFYWSEFTAALEYVSENRAEFFTTFNPRPAAVKITCCDAAEMLKDCYDDYGQVVAFSATLKPFEFYRQLAGLADRNLKTAEFVSPFPKNHRKLMIIPQISSKYSERQKNAPRIAEAIAKISSLRRGNYFAFFPSFEFMERTLERFQAPDGTVVLKQTRAMSRDDFEETLARLSDPAAAHVVFAVQGGVFSEGVDYPGDMVIGAFVIGPPLPSFDLEREKMREYYEKNYRAGFDYAYTYPAMAKAVQAAGRVIRSEKDQGIIVLMDDRFIHPSYGKSMPGDWFAETPRELVSGSILKDIAEFWDGRSCTSPAMEP